MEILEMFNSAFGWAFNLFPYKRAKIWLEIYTKPHETMTKEMKNASIMQGVKDRVISILPMSFLVGLFYAVLMLIGGQIVTGILVFFGALIILPIFIVLFGLFGDGIVWVFAKILGGKGKYSTHFYVNSLVCAGGMIVSTVLFIPSMIPCIGYVFSLLSLPVTVYEIYLQMKTVRMVHGISRNRAAAAVLLPIIIIVAIMILFYVMVIATVLATTAGLGTNRLN
ncbi:MAG: hypothetical protein Q7S22_06825 [Candidatus Micrarchaeota archaeon]|nr:hypothetical protein [Candidatus Micrarchaeota archaeon]